MNRDLAARSRGMSAANNFCPQCGAARQGELRFCASCGFDYWKGAESPGASTRPATATPAPAATPVTEDAAADKKSRRIGCVAIGIIGLIIVAIIASLGGNPDTAGTANSPAATASGATDPSPTTAEVAASAEPTVPPSPEVTVEPEPAFAAIPLTGTGSSVPRFEIPPDNAVIAEITHSGAANFAVWTLSEAGEQTDLLVNTIGNYTGTVLFDEAAGSHSVAFDVEADGPWTITIKPVTEAFRWNGAEVLSGSGDDVVILDPASSGLKSTTVSHQGDGNFVIWTYGGTTDLLVNEIGAYSGEVLLPDGTFLMEISATGPWTVSPPQ